MSIGKHSSKWLNSAARRRNTAKARRNLSKLLGWPVDCVATVGEMIQTLKQRREVIKL